MIQLPVPRHAAIAMTMRPGKSRTRGGQGLEAQGLKIARAAHIPGVRNDEAAVLMQAMKCAPLIGDARANVWHANLLALDRAIADVEPILHQIPMNGVYEIVCLNLRISHAAA